MVIWLYGYMVIWLYGYMVIWLYGYMVIWLYGYMVIWLYDMVMSAHQSVELLSVLASAIYLFSHSIRTYGGGMIPYLKFNILGDYNFDGELVL